MADQEAAQSAPILRLSSDVWTLLGEYLDAGDACRLLALGHAPLSDRVRLGVRTLKLDWVCSRYIELDRVRSATSAFKCLYSFEFRETRYQVRCWTPVSWTLLPQTLTSLSLSFVGAPGHFLQPSTSLFMPEGLLRLVLIDNFLDRSTGWEDEPLAKIDLCGLPPFLQRLRVRSARNLILDPSHFECLPTQLEALELEFSPTFPQQTPRSSANRVVFPSLPSTVKRLKIKDDHSDHWLFNCATLPASLESFTFKVSHFAANADVESEDHSCFNMEGMASHLPHLVEFYTKDLYMSVQDAVRWIPSSVTRLAVCFTPTSEEDAQLAITHFGNVITSSYSDWTDLDEIILNGKNDLPQLNRLDADLVDDDENSTLIIPKHITKLELRHQFHGEVPLSVLSYRLWGGTRSHSHANLNITPQHSITSLDVPHPFELAWLDWLPNTLTKLVCSFNDETLAALLRSMTDPSRFPHLHTISEIRHGLSLDGLLALFPLPPRLRSLRISFTQNGMQAHIDAAQLARIRDSPHLDSLSLTVGTPPQNPVGIFELLNALPCNLKTLLIRGPYVPSMEWPVILPSTLTDLEFNCTFAHVKDQHDLLEGNLSNTNEAPPSLPTFVLPPLLTRYSCQNVAKTLPMGSLPPHLSAFEVDDLEMRNAYFASRAPPSPSLRLDVPVYTGLGSEDPT